MGLSRGRLRLRGTPTRTSYPCPLRNVAVRAIIHRVQEQEPIGLRERKVRETRHALERATVELALESGLEQMTVEQIAERADVSPRTFFNYFGSKEDALLGVAAKETDHELLAGFPDEPSEAGVYEDLKRFLIESFGQRLASDDLLQKRMAALQANPALARRQMAQMHLLLDGLTARVATLLAKQAQRQATNPAAEQLTAPTEPPADAAADQAIDRPSDLVHEAQTLIRLCAVPFMQTFDPHVAPGPAGNSSATLPQAFALLEQTAAKHLASSRHHDGRKRAQL